jgi:hypothetical protein
MQAIVRKADRADLNFILNSFLRSQRSNKRFENIVNELYFPEQTKVLQQLLRSSKTLVLCNSEHPDHLFGYVIGMPDKVTHFIYMKFPYRKMGYGRKLIEAMHPQLYKKTIEASYSCPGWPELSAKFRHLYNPYQGEI